MPQIVFFIHDLSCSGGTERVTSIIANALAAQNYSVTILGVKGNASGFYFPVSETIQIKSLHVNQSSGLKKFFDTTNAIRGFNATNGPDIFISVESIMSIYSVPALLGSGIHHVVWEHFNFKTNLGLKLRDYARQLALVFADDIVTLTARDANFWKRGAWIRRSQITNIPNPISIDHKRIAITPSKTVISIGRLRYQKGFDLLIDSWAKVIERGIVDWKLKIIGDGPEHGSLTDQIRHHQVEKFVELIPATKSVFQFYEDASIFCLSSRFEGFPMVLLEALYFEVPMVSFNCNTGPEELISHGIDGLLVEETNTLALADALESLIIDDKLRNEMRENLKLKKEQFALNKIIALWQNILQIN